MGYHDLVFVFPIPAHTFHPRYPTLKSKPNKAAHLGGGGAVEDGAQNAAVLVVDVVEHEALAVVEPHAQLPLLPPAVMPTSYIILFAVNIDIIIIIIIMRRKHIHRAYSITHKRMNGHQ